jgi:cytochrome c oxidase assembly factor CtaG
MANWTFDPAPVCSAVAIGIAYAVRARTLAAGGRPVRASKQLCFYLGFTVFVLAIVSPVDRIGEERLFYVHMIQHLMLGDIAPLLIVLGLNGPLLRPILALPGFGHLRMLAHPLVALPLWAINLYAWHLPGLYQAALANPVIHGFEHLMFFGAGLLFWAALLEPLPGPVWFGSGAKAVYVLVARTLGAVLGNVFVWVETPLYPDYTLGEKLAGTAPLTDQAIAGAIMFTEGALVTLVLFAWLFMGWTRESERRQELAEQGHDPVVAARAARYGRRRLAPGPPP